MTAGVARVDELDTAIAAATPPLDDRERRVALCVYRLLATGRAARPAAVASVLDEDVAEVERILHGWPGVFRDEGGDVIGFWGLSLHETAHRLDVEGTVVFAWCAWDPFFLAPLIGPLEVTTQDPTTGATIHVRVDAAGAAGDMSHPGAVLSFLRPDRPWDDDVVTSFCHYVLLFGDMESARRWTGTHPGTFVIGVDEATELARRHVRRTYAQALPE